MSSTPQRPNRFLRPVVAGVYAFLLIPVFIVVATAVNGGETLAFPPDGISLRWFGEFFDSRQLMSALYLSLRLAVTVTLLSLTIATLGALYAIRYARPRFRLFIQTLVLGPLQFPRVLTGLALLLFFHSIDFQTAGGFSSLVLGHLVVTAPLSFIMVFAALLRFDISIEEAAISLGASPLTTFRRITLPLLRGGLVPGAIFSFIYSFDEFPVSLMLSGVGTTTLPVSMYDYLRFSFDPTIAAASTISLLISASLLIVVHRTVGLEALTTRTDT